MSETHELFFLVLKQKDNKIEFEINCQETNPKIYYNKEFSLNDLQKISKYFLIFDSIDECFLDLKQKFEKNNYEIISNESDKNINIKIKTNISKKDFILEIPVKQKLEQEKIYSKFLYNTSSKNIDDNLTGLLKVREPDKRYIEIIDKKIKELENVIKLKKDDNILFDKSTIIKNDNERKLLESFIIENDKCKKNINPVLLFKAIVDGDNSQNFHKKCDYLGATLTIVQTEHGRRFGGYTSISWDKNLSNYYSKGVNFLFSLDTRKFYLNSSGSNHTYHNNSYGPTFGGGHDFYISSGCLSNQSSYSSRSNYDMSSSYELNGGIQSFKVIDYEVFQI